MPLRHQSQTVSSAHAFVHLLHHQVDVLLHSVGIKTLVDSAIRKSPRKSARRPVYVLCLELPPRGLDLCLTPAKDAANFEVFVAQLVARAIYFRC
jgi:hypothetical protein